MACMNTDGTITASAAAMLRALQTPSTDKQIADTTGFPLFRIRSGLRDMIAAQLVEEQSGLYRVTEKGKRFVGQAQEYSIG